MNRENLKEQKTEAKIGGLNGKSRGSEAEMFRVRDEVTLFGWEIRRRESRKDWCS